MSVRRLVWLDLVAQQAYRSPGQRYRALNSRKWLRNYLLHGVPGEPEAK